MVKDLFSHLTGKKIIILTDYDGTITPIVAKPELAVLTGKMRKVLRELAQRYPLAVISGRPLREIRKLVKLKNIFYAGNHGLEIKGKGKKFVYPPALKFKPLFAKLASKLKSQLGQIPGVLVENKGFSLAVHYRLVKPTRLKEISRVLKKILKNKRQLRVEKGKKVFDIRPAFPWDKGKAVQWLIKSLYGSQTKQVLPIYLGDDTTDEDVFKVLKKKGITILVAEEKKNSQAQYRLKNVSEVYKFFNRLKKLPR